LIAKVKAVWPFYRNDEISTIIINFIDVGGEIIDYPSFNIHIDCSVGVGKNASDLFKISHS
jgi:hypothetical protein